MGDSLQMDGVFKHDNNMVLAQNFLKIPGTIFAIENKFAHAKN